MKKIPQGTEKKAQLVCWFVLSIQKINAAVLLRNTLFSAWRSADFYANKTAAKKKKKKSYSSFCFKQRPFTV